MLEISLKYTADRARVIGGLKRVSSRAFASTAALTDCPACSAASGWRCSRRAKGLMTDREARQQRVGGEVLCYVW